MGPTRARASPVRVENGQGHDQDLWNRNHHPDVGGGGLRCLASALSPRARGASPHGLSRPATGWIEAAHIPRLTEATACAISQLATATVAASRKTTTSPNDNRLGLRCRTRAQFSARALLSSVFCGI